MLFKSILSAGLLAAAANAQVGPIITSLQEVQAGLLGLNGAFLAYNGGLIEALPILISAQQLQGSLTRGTQTAQNSANLTTDEAVQLVPAVQNLTAQANTTLTTIISKAPVFRQNGLDGIVLNQIQSSRNNSNAYSGAIISKIPASLQPFASSLTAPLDAGFEQVIAAYQPRPLFALPSLPALPGLPTGAPALPAFSLPALPTGAPALPALPTGAPALPAFSAPAFALPRFGQA